MNKKYWIFGGLSLLALSTYAGKKSYDAFSVLGKLETKLQAIKGLSVTNTGIRMKLDIALINPTNTPLNVNTGGTLTVREIKVFDLNGQEVATARPNINRINIVPGGTYILEDVPVETKYGTILNSLLGGLSSDPNNYEIRTVIETMTGNIITI
jgi:hypothetical protein